MSFDTDRFRKELGELSEKMRTAKRATSVDVSAAKYGPDLSNEQSHRKISVTIRLSPDVINHFRDGLPGWQGRIDEALRDWISKNS